MKRIHAVLSISLGVALLLSGCGAPERQKYSQPATPAPPEWHGSQSAQAAGAPVASAVKWQEFFTDDRLRQVIDLALKSNRDLRLAALNVERVEAQFRIQRAQQYPTVNALLSAQAYWIPKDMTSKDQGYVYDDNNLGVETASWELDLFGRVRSLKSAALEQYLATEQTRDASQIALVAGVASSYLALGADRENLRLAQATLDAQRATYQLIQQSRDQGIGSDLELRQAQSQVQAAEVEIARYTGQLTLDENALNLLVGAEVPAALLPGELGPEAALKDISPGLPSEVLLHRPDILTIEHQLKAAYANIDAARANFFPRITLTGGGGLASGALQQLFSIRARTWTFAPNVTLPIFDAGTRKASYHIAQVDKETAVAEYEKAIQTAFREVSDSLSQRTWLLEQQKAQQSLVSTLEETYRLSDLRYKEGIDNYLSVLVAQRSLYSGQQALLSLRLARMSNLVTLYKVLGGGL